jgi:uncharacterized Fe-S center protein
VRATVYFAPLEDGADIGAVAEKAAALFDRAGFASRVPQAGLVAIKQHFGEGDNVTYLRPEVTREIVGKVKEAGGHPFVTDSNTLYRGRRSNAVDHLTLAHEHGFSLENLGAPVIIADGLVGVNQCPVEINQKHYQKVNISAAAYHARGIVSLAHVTGHPGANLAATIKNLAMGLSSRAGKLSQHSSMVPRVDREKCTACATCARWCPPEAITVQETAAIDEGKCIGCGECLAVCPYGAITFSWDETSVNLQEKMAEHVLGILQNKKEHCAFMNFIINVTKGCDCFGTPQQKQMPDVGLLACTDPVAVDAASPAVIQERIGKDIFKQFHPEIDYTVQLKHGEKIGLGTRDYVLKKI